MPGKGHRFTSKEDKLARRIEREYLRKGYSKKRAKKIGYSVVSHRKKLESM